MSYPPPPPVPGSPQGQPPGAKPRLRGRIPLRLSIIFLVLGVVGIVVGSVIAYNGALKKVDDFQRISLPSPTSDQIKTTKVDLNGTGGWIVYYESKDADPSSIPAIPVRITSPSGKQQTLRTPYGGTSGGKKVKTLTYDYDGHNGVALWQFNITETGTYTVEVAANTRQDSDAGIAFGRSIGKSTIAGALFIVLGVLLLIAGIVLLIVGLVKRSRSKKELAAAQAYYGGGYPPPGYGQNQPGYGQSQQPGYGQNPPGYGQNQQPGYGQNPQGSPQGQSWQQPPSLRKDDDQQGPWPPRQQ